MHIEKFVKNGPDSLPGNNLGDAGDIFPYISSLMGLTSLNRGKLPSTPTMGLKNTRMLLKMGAGCFLVCFFFQFIVCSECFKTSFQTIQAKYMLL